MKTLDRFADDFLLMAGCALILYGLSLWNMPITFIVAGLMLIAFGVLVGLGKARRNAAN